MTIQTCTLESLFYLPSYLVVGKEDDLMSSLTISNKFQDDKYGFGKGEDVCMCRQHDGAYGVPRLYAWEKWPHLFRTYKDDCCDGTKISVAFNEAKQGERPELKRDQDAALLEFFARLRAQESAFKGGCLCSACGTGKSVMGVKMIATLGLTTVILVHKGFLMDQWVKRITEFSDITQDEVGFVVQNKCQLKDKKVIIAMAQSLTSREYGDEFRNFAGLLLVDEVHRFAAPVFQTALWQIPARYRIGLTATPDRQDGLSKVFRYHIGPVLTKTSCKNLTPDVYQVPTRVMVNPKNYVSKKAGKSYLGTLVTLLVKNQQRNDIIVKNILSALGKGRKILVLSQRVEHLEDLAKFTKERSLFKFTYGYYVGGKKKEELETTSRSDLILATTAMAKEGLDIPDIDVLILTSVASDVVQDCGRVLRHAEGKRTPIIVDIVDECPECKQFARSRQRKYREQGFNIKKLYPPPEEKKK